MRASRARIECGDERDYAKRRCALAARPVAAAVEMSSRAPGIFRLSTSLKKAAIYLAQNNEQ